MRSETSYIRSCTSHNDILDEDVPQAFSHWSYVYTKRELLVCDLQGVHEKDKKIFFAVRILLLYDFLFTCRGSSRDQEQLAGNSFQKLSIVHKILVAKTTFLRGDLDLALTTHGADEGFLMFDQTSDMGNGIHYGAKSNGNASQQRREVPQALMA